MISNILYYENSSGFGGSSNSLNNLLSSLDRTKFKPIVVINNFGSQIIKIKNAEIIKIVGYKEPDKLSYLGLLIFFLRFILPETIVLYRIIKRKKISLVHINNNIILGIPAIFASKLSGIPCLCHVRETRNLTKREKYFMNWISKFIVLNKDALGIYSHETSKAKIKLVYNGVKIIYDGISIDKVDTVKESSFLKELKIENSSLVGVIGRIVPGKGQKEFVLVAKKVVQHYPDVKFVIVGDAKGDNLNYYNEVTQLVRTEQLEDYVFFTGWRTDIYNILSALKIFVFTSTTFPEGLPNSIIEAMAFKKPVVSTNIPGASDIVIDNKTGFLVPPGDINAMADKILFLLKNSVDALKMGEIGRKRIEEEFDLGKTVRDIEMVYEEILIK